MTAKPRISIALDHAQIDAMREIEQLTGATVDVQIRLAINRFVREQLQGLVVQMQSEDRRRKAVRLKKTRAATTATRVRRAARR